MPRVNKSIDKAMRRSWQALPKGLQANIRPLLLKQVKPLANAPMPVAASPLLSVIVPVYNVQEYIDECLSSLLEQDYGNMEIIVVDDGSTDGSTSVVETYVARDKRFSMIRIDNSGNGTARNVGIGIARGEYITFVDSDDVVLPEAYTTMVNQLIRSGSDFVVGAFLRQKGVKQWLPKMMTELHSSDRIGITVEEFPEIVRDVFLWNKVFKRSYWEECVGRIPEGVLYEDQETIVRAFLRARSFDVLEKPVYTWRIREDNSSITQQKGDLGDLVDRMRAALVVTDLVENEGKSETKRAWYVKSLGEDLKLYIGQVPHTGDDYWDVLQASVKKLYGMAGQEVLTLIPVEERVLAYLIAEDRRDDLVDVLISLRDDGPTYPIFARNGMLYAEPIYESALEIPLHQDVLRFHPVDMFMHTRLIDMSWNNAETLEIVGAAYIAGLDSSEFSYTTTLALVNSSTDERIPVVVNLDPDNWIDRVSGDRWNSYAGCTFRAVIDTEVLQGVTGSPTPSGQEWSLVVTVEVAGITMTDVIRVRDGERLPFQLPTGSAVRPCRVVAQIDRNQGLRFRVIRYGSMATAVKAVGRTLRFEFKGEPSTLPSQLFLKNGNEEVPSFVDTSPGGRTFTFELPIPVNNHRELVWDVQARLEGRQPHFVGWPAASTDWSSLPSPDGPVNVLSTGYGYIRVKMKTWRVTVSDAEVDPTRGVLVVTGRSAYLSSSGERMLDLILATNRSSILPVEISSTPGADTYTAVFPLSENRWGYGHVTPETGHYKLFARTIDDNGVVRRHSVTATGLLSVKVPEESLSNKLRVVLTAEDRERRFVVKILAPYKPEERGSRAQQQLRAAHLAGSSPIEPEVVLFESFAGKSASDSVRAISDELGRTHGKYRRYWTISDFSVPVPDGCIGVLMYSAEWYRILNTAGILINNNNFPHYFRKRDGQFYLQTWHGTPLKRIGNHTPIANLTPSYRRLMNREAKAWDLLIAQNDFAARKLPEAFGYSGDVVAAGYPRNDLLHRVDTAHRRTKIRESLGLSEDTYAILYAPTWRDNARTSQNKFDTVNYLEFGKIADAYGTKCTVLFRGHHNVAGQRTAVGGSDYIDVTNFPEIADLYLAADIMITDYSSSMFDFSGTGKPILFLAPDIQEYENVTRGFYFDFVEEAPGPILSSTSEVIDVISRITEVEAEYQTKYSNFVSKYSALDDGGAARRVISAVSLFQEQGVNAAF